MWDKLLERSVMILVGILIRKVPDGMGKSFVKFRSWWNGKCIAVIGPTASGKNSLFSKLQSLDAPSEHIQTRGVEKVDTFKFYWPLPDKSSVGFKCKRGVNVGGELDERERYWLGSISQADVIFYLVDLAKLQKDESETLKRIQSDFKWLATNIPKFKAESSIQILINKVDLVLGSCELSEIPRHIEAEVGPSLQMLEKYAKDILGPNFRRISGISPISMIDNHIFSTYFTSALQDVFDAKGTKK